MWEFLLHNTVILALLGILTGILGGLFGIGGGTLIVPGLLFTFESLNFPPNILMHYAIGTSFGIMIFTALSAAISHQRRDNITWQVFAYLAPGMIPGIISGALFAHFLHSHWLKTFFGLFFLIVAVKMALGFKEKEAQSNLPPKKIVILAGLIAGFLSALLGVGGGFIVVPFLKYYGFPMKKVIGTSAAMTLVAALTGTISYAMTGLANNQTAWASGYIWWPAVILVAPFTILFAPLGVYLTVLLPDRFVRIAFSILLCAVSIKMLW